MYRKEFQSLLVTLFRGDNGGGPTAFERLVGVLLDTAKPANGKGISSYAFLILNNSLNNRITSIYF